MRNRFYKDPLLSQKTALPDVTYSTLYSFNERAEHEHSEQPLWVEAQILAGSIGLPATAHITLAYGRNTASARSAVTYWFAQLQALKALPTAQQPFATITGVGRLFPDHPVLLVRSTWCTQQHARLNDAGFDATPTYVPHITVTPQAQARFTAEQPVYCQQLMLFRKTRNRQRHSVVLADVG